MSRTIGTQAGTLLYTEESLSTPTEDMSLLRSRSVTPNAILRILIFGFSLVLLLLLVAGIIGVKNTRSIHAGAARLVTEQSLTSRLINEIRVEQSTLNAVLYQLSSSPEDINGSSLTGQLQEADDALSRIVANAAGTPEESLWRELSVAARSFSEEARRLVVNYDNSLQATDALVHRHEQVVRLIDKLVASSTSKVAALQREIERQAQELLDQSIILLGSCLILAFVCAVLTVRTTSAMFAQMQWQASELSRVSWHMLEGQEAAARRFSHELHDELGQSLTAVKANLMSFSPDNIEARRADCIHLVDEAISNVRELSQLLRPVILDDFGLDASLRWLAERFTYRTNTKVEFHSNATGRLNDETETQLFRIAQEALTNVARHSGASEVRMELRQEGERIRLVVSDNGRGLGDSSDNGGGFGMIGMRARARHAGGELLVRSTPNAGVTIDVWVPAVEVEKNAEEDPHLARR